MVDKDQHSNQLVVNEVVVDATVDEVWEAVSTEEGREQWLSEDGESAPTIVVESADEPQRISWWWWQAEEPPRRVELWIAPVPDGTRVIAIESAPGLPLPMLAASLAFATA
jgi:hypothetical protein